jgi:hypothetical protein
MDLYGEHHGHSIYASSGKLIWRYNYHKGDSGPVRAGSAVRLANSAGSLVHNNVFSNDGGRRYWGLCITKGTHHIYNNVFYNNNYGILMDTGYSKVISRNNIFFGTPGETWYYVDNQTGDYQGDYNIYYGCANGWLYHGDLNKTFSDWKSASGQDRHSLNVDPGFVGASAHDFHLKPTSPAIDAGINVDIKKDYDGNAIPQGSAPDIGAFEQMEDRVTSQ